MSATNPKRIAIFIDGTWNQAGEGRDSNVAKLYRGTSSCNGEQVKAYIPGVGTDPTDIHGDKAKKSKLQFTLRWLPKKCRRLIAGIGGWGTDFNIKEAYKFLCENYSRTRNDQIYLFGFSRGAFAARSLAGFVDTVGVLLASRLDLVETAYKLYRHPNIRIRKQLPRLLHKISGYRKASKQHENDLPVYFIGIWDTVSSLGIANEQRYIPGISLQYHETALPEAVSVARHALALHELRDSYEPLLWTNLPAQQDVIQMWFAGCHSDVGGGHEWPNQDLANYALGWMTKEARIAGLEIDNTCSFSKFVVDEQQVHHNFEKAFLVSAPTVRSALINFQDLDENTRKSLRIHPSAIARLAFPSAIDYQEFKHPVLRWRLEDVDAETWKMHLSLLAYEISEENIRRIKLLSAKNALLGEDWPKSYRAGEMAKAINIIRDTCTSQGQVTSDELRQFARAVAGLSLACTATDFPWELSRAMLSDNLNNTISALSEVLDLLLNPRHQHRKLNISVSQIAPERRNAIHAVLLAIAPYLHESIELVMALIPDDKVHDYVSDLECGEDIWNKLFEEGTLSF